MKNSENQSESEDFRFDFFFTLTLFLTLRKIVRIRAGAKILALIFSSFSHSFSHFHPYSMFDFQKLEVYQKAKLFHTDIIALIQDTKIHKATADQLFRASLSIPLNIAEGSGRFSKPDRRNFFVIARSSIFETVSILDILFDANSLSDSQFHNLLSKAEELSKMLFAMIRNLEK